MTTSLDGLSSGLDTSSVINALMAVDSAPQQALVTKKAKVDSAINAWADVNLKLTSLKSALSPFAFGTALKVAKATSSDSSVITATGTGRATGSMTFQVLSLAAAGQQAATGYSSGNDVVGAGTLTMATGLGRAGFTHAHADAALGAGNHTLTVTQASAAARVTSAAVSGPITIAGNGDLAITAGGTTTNITLADGTYNTADDFASAITAALSSAGVSDVKATTVNGAVQFATTNEGSAASLTVTGGAAAALGVTPATATGTDATVTLDGTATTLNDIRAGGTATLTAPTGTLSLTTNGHLAAGTSTVTVVRASGASTTVTNLAQAINSAAGGASAAVIDTGGSAGVELALTSKATGTAGDVTVDADGFANLTGFSTLRAAADAQLQLGSQTITRSSNSITDLLSGVTINLVKAAPGQDVTVTAAQDTDSAVTQVKALVDAINAYKSTVAGYTKADPKTPGVLNGASDLLAFGTQLDRALMSASNNGSSYKLLSQLGVEIQRDGTYKFTESKLRSALADNPNAVNDVLARTGSALDTRLAYRTATDDTAKGSYAVTVTRAGTQAQMTGSGFTNAGAAENLTFTFGGLTGAYAVAAGATVDTVAAGLNAMFATSKLGLSAAVIAGTLQVTSTSSGSAATFSVASDNAAGPTGLGGQTATGTDAQGTIDGVAVTGSGNTLTSTSGASKGLSVTVGATAAEVAAAGGALSLGSVTYSSGAGGGLLALINRGVNQYGLFSADPTAARQNSTKMQKEIDAWQVRLDAKEAAYRKQFAAMETTLAQLKASAPNFDAMLGTNKKNN